MLIQFNPDMFFNILRLVEEGSSYDELVNVGYDSRFVEFVFKFRQYVLVCKEKREVSNGYS